jgi:hypothetical protein
MSDKNYENKYSCVECGGLASELHEIFPGANRLACVIHKIQVPVCRYHHQAYHKSKAMAKVLCDKMGLDYDRLVLAMNTRYTNPDARDYLAEVEKHMKGKLKEYVI